MFLLTNGTIVTFNLTNQVINNGAIAINKATITDIGSSEVLCRKYPQAKQYPLDNKLVLPGMINAHTHLYSAFACGMPISGSTENFLRILDNIWWKLDRVLTLEDVYYSALVVGIQIIKSGTTTIFDHHSSPAAIPKSLDAIAAALSELGLRANLCYEVSNRDGQKKTQQAIQENLRWINQVNSSSATSLLTGTFGLHASFTINNTTLQQAAELGTELHSGFHIHVAEDKADQQHAQKKYGKTVVERLAKFGILGKKTIAAHGVHITQSDIERLKEYDTILVHNPGSNMNNAVGIAPIPAMLKKRLLVGLGTDGLGNDLFTELRTASFIHKLAHKNPIAFLPNQAIQLAIENNRNIASRFFAQPLGIIVPGSAADLIIIDYHPHTPLNSDNIASHLIYGMLPTKIDTVFINGKKILDAGRLVSIDEETVLAKANKLARKLWNRL
ncbi:MAG: putative aminohydrolase SsnA [bacterium]